VNAAPIIPGLIVWVELGVGQGREQGGRRPALIVSSEDHLVIADRLATVVMCTSRDRRWPNHVALSGPTGLSRPTYAMTEQVRTIDRGRIVSTSGSATPECLREVRSWLDDWLG
jgi:mRNA interferase MazF